MSIKIPKSHPVQPLRPGEAAEDPAECYTCRLAWDDGKVTSMTPAPAGRCPFEAFHADPGRKRKPRKARSLPGASDAGWEPEVTPMAAGCVSLRMTREQADALYLLLAVARGSLKVPNNVRVFRIYQALHFYFAKEGR